MSAITGIFYRDGRPVKIEEITKMNKKLSHRGPDGSSLLIDGSVALGHQMLFTTPESLNEKLPFYDEISGLFITADARIDNRDKLSELLNIENDINVSDSYFILKSYERWGEKCPEQLIGDFAFAIWDRHRNKLFCARDHIGVKPFYYYLDEKVFIFSTEIKSIFAVDAVPKKLNETSIAYFLELISEDGREKTFYSDIFRLSAAHKLVIKCKEFNKTKYWELEKNSKVNFNSEEEYIDAFLKVFSEAVECRLRTAFPVGSMLSGGLDSSSVACTAQKIVDNKEKNDILQTFSAVFDSVTDSNERNYIEKVLFDKDFDGHFIKADEIDPLKEISDYFFLADSPYVVPNTFMNYHIYLDASKNGVRVLLDGLEGDEIVSHGYGFLSELLITIQWRKLISEFRGLHKVKSVPYRNILFTTIFNSLPGFFKLKMVSLIKKWRIGSKFNIIQLKFANELNLDKIKDQIDLENFEYKTSKEYHYMDITSSLIQNEMEIADWMSSPFHIELRHPFFDKRLIEFCFALPTEIKLHDGWDRYIMRKAMRNILPEEIQWRESKGDLSFNFILKFLTENPLLENFLNDHLELTAKYVDIEKFEIIYDECKSGNTKRIMYIWNALLLDLWFKEQN